MSKLTRGVNITRWFGYVKADDTATFKGYLLDEDLQHFKKLGIHFVRLCVTPGVIYRDGKPDPTNRGYIDQAIDKLEKAGLAVLWDLHDNGEMKLHAPGNDNSGFTKFWEALARHYKGRQETSTVFELVNEPVFQQNANVWYALQAKTVAAVRAIDPKRTIMVASTAWNGIDALLAMKPLEEKNLIYSFHCYDPFLFSHQGATWTGEQQKVMRDIPFPSSPEAVEAMINKIPAEYQASVRDYGEKRYGAQYLLERFNAGMRWGAQNHVPVLLGEFGSYPPVCPLESRAHWFDAAHDAIQKLGLPNAVWGYDDAFGFGRSVKDGKVVLDPVTLKHLYKVN
jgi:aryl-phospho-beta-D-glucosidase BglC (GH1 family)